MHFRILALILLATLILSGCQNIAADLSEGKAEKADSYNLISQSTTAWAFQISPFSENTEADFEGYPILNGPIELYKPEFGRIHQILSDSTNFPGNDELKMCVFTPNIGIDFLDDNQESVQRVVLSLNCDRFKFLKGKQKDRLIDFDDHKASIAEIFYPIFKEDPYFQASKN